MNSPHRTSGCRIIPITSARPARAAQSRSVLDLIRGQRVIDLNELARSIHADRDLCKVLTESASRKFGWQWCRIEDAIVLLGVKRLCALLSTPIRRDPSAKKLRRTLPINRITASANLCRLEMMQGELE